MEDHPLRYQLANELHARPFPTHSAPGFAVYLALKPEHDAARRDRQVDWDHLLAFLDRFGAKHPQPGATHYFGEVGKYRLKWESHTEFVTYTIFGAGVAAKAFDGSKFDVFPKDWLDAAPGMRITSALIRVEELAGSEQAEISDRLAQWFVPESLAVAHVLDEAAVLASDFRIDTAGHLRFAIFAEPGTGSRRIGRIIQRLCEIETYKTMAMIGFVRARELDSRLGNIGTALNVLVSAMNDHRSAAEDTLANLLSISAELEDLAAQSSFRFGATRAYSAILAQRVEVLRERRFEGRQTMAEFMMRRFDPAMRTVQSTSERMQNLSDRAVRAAELLRTRVDVERSAQNQSLLASMDRRADLQLRLQRTVEGLSVVAISYYAVNLAAYLAYPIAEPLDITKGLTTAILTPVVLVAVWILVQRIRRAVER